ncbi:hypothetical protein AVEN_208208-1 [Araneus ventricosus]|uniref:Uncharacterized protein n=1 Tax=Araneus ventricosus TaxID=182803 RepID=A0A4Y2LG91_ARAVE|nr:hypothetical protein AVEN_208208-1 [Araneus ventricosus]
MIPHHANPIGQKPVKIGVACFHNQRVIISITPRHLDWALSECRRGGVEGASNKTFTEEFGKKQPSTSLLNGWLKRGMALSAKTPFAWHGVVVKDRL